MIAVVTILLAFPFGYLFRSRLAANVTYALAYLWGYTFQTLYLTRMWVGGDNSAFPQPPKEFPIAYGIFSAAIFAVGFGLVALGYRLRNRRRVNAS